MGYRSDVYIKALKKHEQSILQTLASINALDWIDVHQKDDTYVFIGMPDLKWYDSYNDVRTIESKISSINEDLEVHEACLFAIGEDQAIHSEIGSLWDLDVETYITVDGMNGEKDVTKEELKKSYPELFV